jgi:hypothetical protein
VSPDPSRDEPRLAAVATFGALLGLATCWVPFLGAFLSIAALGYGLAGLSGGPPPGRIRRLLWADVIAGLAGTALAVYFLSRR